MDRRARGEQITVAQNFFEPPQLAEASQPSMQQGDTTQGLAIQLASAPPPARASRIQIVEARNTPKLSTPEKAQREPGGRWTVQVGSFSSRADAREQLALVIKRFGRPFAQARAVAEKDDGKFRSRFAGLSEDQAKSACKTLKAKKQPCLVMAPSRG
jgi:D-alanyl-D-alanine carboxypeptidase (penicillin-binding protein 5/6)